MPLSMPNSFSTSLYKENFENVKRMSYQKGKKEKGRNQATITACSVVRIVLFPLPIALTRPVPHHV